jgi:hypothetical protein
MVPGPDYRPPEPPRRQPHAADTSQFGEPADAAPAVSDEQDMRDAIAILHKLMS